MQPEAHPNLRNLRTRYQRGLLAWLKDPESGNGLGDMRAALLSAALASEYGHATFWRAAEMVLDALSAGQLAPDVEIRRLVGRYDQQLRRCVTGDPSLDTDLTVSTLNALSRLRPPPAPVPEPAPLAPLAATLEATAAILPLVASPKTPRFPKELAEAWDTASKRLALAWSSRRTWGKADLRPAIFALCAAAVDLEDPDCLTLAEALASATDRLDDPTAFDDAHLVAAVTASIECLIEPDALDHDAFPDRVKHLSQRLESCARPGDHHRSPTLDKLFFDEAAEHLESMYAALDALPPDAEAMAAAARALSRLAEPLDLDILTDLAYAFSEILSRRGDDLDLEQEDTRQVVMDLLGSLDEQVRQVEAGKEPEIPLLADALLAVLEGGRT